LFRVSAHSAELELELARRNIPFVKYGGAKFLEAAHIKDIVCALRWCENPKDRIAGFRTLQLLPGIGPGTATKVLKKVDGRPQLAKIVKRLEVPVTAAEHWQRLIRLVRGIHKSRTTWPADPCSATTTMMMASAGLQTLPSLSRSLPGMGHDRLF
jgi:DNA helicase II / ATP-dependent DNA helicase PcrA